MITTSKTAIKLALFLFPILLSAQSGVIFQTAGFVPSLTFPATPVGTADPVQTASFYNGSVSTVTITSASISGTNAADFTVDHSDCHVSNNPSNPFLPIGSFAGCTVNVTFNPVAGATGTRTASFQFIDSASDSPTTLSLTGTVSGSGSSPIVSLSPSSLSFSSQTVGTTSGTQTITLTNTGTTTLTVSSVTASGDFGSTTTCASVAAAGTCNIVVSFTPTTSGTRTGVVTITDSAAGSPHTASLSGIGASVPSGVPGTTVINVGSTVIQTNIKRVGVNLDGVNYYQKMPLKNLTVNDPGFNPVIWGSTVACSSGSTTTCNDAATYNGWNTGFWAAGSTLDFMSGAAINCTASLVSYVNPGGAPVYTFGALTLSPRAKSGSSCNTSASIAAQDWFIIHETVGPSDSRDGAAVLSNWWVATSGGGTITIQNSDIPPSPSTSTQAADVKATLSSDSATLSHHFDSDYESGKSFLNLNGTYQIQFMAKGKGGSNQINVSFFRGSTAYLAATPVTLTGSWASYTVNFTASETGSQPNNAYVNFATINADEFLIDNVQVIKTSGQLAWNTSVFRDEVAVSLVNMKPQSIRMWTGMSLGDTLDNMLIDQFGRSPSNSNIYLAGTTAVPNYNGIAYSIPDFLGLIQAVNSQTGNTTEASIVLPITLSPVEASNLIDYLSGTCAGATTYALKRCATGQTTPWTQVIPKIHLEFGNEPWNGTFQGGSINNFGSIQGQTVYAARSQLIFGVMKANANYDATHTSLVIGAQQVNSYALQQLQNGVTNNDELSVAPYMMNSPTDASSTQAIWGPALTEAQEFFAPGAASGTAMVCGEYVSGSLCPSAGFFTYLGTAQNVYGGGMYLDFLAEANSTNPKKLILYETNFGTGQSGSATYNQAQLNAYASAWGAGLAQTNQELLFMQFGGGIQNLFSLDQPYVNAVNDPAGCGGLSCYTVNLWGIVTDIGGPIHQPRPQYLGAQVVNNAIYPNGSMLQTTQGGTPTYNQSILNTVAMNNSNLVQSFAFTNGSGSYSLVMLNTGVTGSQVVSFSGPNAPTGTVNVTTLTSANLSDTNEASGVISPVTSTVTSPTTYTLPPYSIVTFTYGVATGSTPKTYYVDSAAGSDSNAGTTTTAPWQTIAKVNGTVLNPGDSVLFLKGDTWREQLNITTSGSASAPITFGNYGTGAAPIIDAGAFVAWTLVSGNVWKSAQTSNPLFPQFAGTPGIQVGSQGAVTAAYNWFWDGSTYLYVYSTTNPTAIVEIPARPLAINHNSQSYIVIDGINARGAQTYGIGPNGYVGAGQSNFVVKNGVAELNYSNGVEIYDATGNVTGFTLTNETLRYNGSSGVKQSQGGTATWSGSTVTNNVIYNNCLYPVTTGTVDNINCGGIYLASPYTAGVNGTGTLVTGNTVYSNGNPALGNQNIGNGIWFDTLTGVTANNNVAYSNSNNGIYAEKNTNDVIGPYNVSYCNATTTGGSAGNAFTGQIVLAAGLTYLYGNPANATGNLIYENTGWSCTGSNAALVVNFEYVTGVTISGNVIQNNIFHGVSGAYSVELSTQINNGTNGSGNVINHNSIGVQYSNFIYWGANYSTYSAFEAVWGTTNSMQLDPAVTNAGANNYSLTAGSPARGAGVNYGSFTAPCGGNPDLGGIPFSCGIICPAFIAAGSSGICTSATSVSWSATLGTVSPATGTSTTVTVPSGVAATNAMLGVQVTPLDSIWNIPVNNLPLDPASSTRITSTTTASNAPVTFQQGWGISYADATTPTKSFKSYYTGTSITAPTPTVDQWKIENGIYDGSSGYLAAANSSGSPDRHSLVVNRATGVISEIYGLLTYGATLTCKDGITQGCNASGSAQYPWYNYNLSVGTAGGTIDAAGLLIAPLTLRLSDLEGSATLTHPLRYTACTGCFSQGQTAFSWWRFPATAVAGGLTTGGACSYSGAGTPSTNCLPMGAWLRLNSSYSVSSGCAANAVCAKIMTGLKTFGMILADTGIQAQVTISSDVCEDPAVCAGIQLAQTEALHLTNFQVIDPSPIMKSATSWQATPSGATAYAGPYGGDTYPLSTATTNTYQAPNQQLIVTGSGNTASIAVQPVSIGTLTGQITQIVAGGETWTIPAWVVGATNQTITWTVTSGCGTVAAGVYTAPSSISSCTGTADLHGVAVADPVATTDIYFRLLPAGTDHIDSGSTTTTTSTDGSQTWYLDWGVDWAGHSSTGQVANTSQFLTGNLATQLGSVIYAEGDIHYYAVVPNGQYLVHAIFDVNQDTCPGGYGVLCASWYTPGGGSYGGDFRNRGVFHFETQGGLKRQFVDIGQPNSYAYYTQTDFYIPALVTNNYLTFSVLPVAPDLTYSGSGLNYTSPYNGANFAPATSSKLGFLNGLEIIPDTATSPHWTIDTNTAQWSPLNQQVNTIASGQTLQPFTIIDYYTGIVDPTWSVIQQPYCTGTGCGASISPSGALSLASGTYYNNQPVIVQATDGTRTATVSIFTIGAATQLF